MPIYSYQCQSCKWEFDRYVPYTTSDNPSCNQEDCQGVTEKVWRVSRHTPASVFPYVTRNILPGGKPVEVTSSAHLESLCKQHGKTHRPDVAWTEQASEHLEYDTRTRTIRRIYKEGSGRGLPGSW